MNTIFEKSLILIWIVAMILCFGAAQVQAVECYQGYSTSCHEWNPDVKDACGNGCSYHYDAATKTLTVVAENENAIIARGVFMPYAYQTDTSKKTFPSENGDIKVENVIIDGNFKRIDAYAFLDLGATISSKDGPIYAETIGRAVFVGSTIASDVIVDKLYFGRNGGSSELFNRANLADGIKIYCIEKDTAECRQYIMDSCGGDECDTYISALLSNDALFAKNTKGCVKPAENLKCSKCKSGYLEKDGDCISSSLGCGAGYKDMGGFCNRIQYTPAEAAAILNDDNNSVTITFKK